MKKAFDANVSRSKPRMRLGSLLVDSSGAVEAAPSAELTQAHLEAIAQQVAHEGAGPTSAPLAEGAQELTAVLKARVGARTQKPTAAEALRGALEMPLSHADAPEEVIEVQTAPPAAPAQEQELELGSTEPQAQERRERLKERLRAVRENPRPEPLPDTVAEAGVLAVERISALQTELSKARALNLALVQDLEAARRQAERATEEARLRMDEAKRLSKEMESRLSLLSELERELAALEGERNETLLALQESRQLHDAGENDRRLLQESLDKKDAEISDCLAEEERLASELEAAQDSTTSLRRTLDTVKSERDTLARQVSDLTRERAELLEARKALEAVHRALSSAVMR